MARFARRLPGTVSLAQLVEQLCEACESPELLASVSSLGMQHHSPQLKVEVMGGPEDGRTLLLVPGDVLGRWSPVPPQRCSQPLYVEQPAFDPTLSRGGVLSIDGPARVRAVRGPVWHVAAVDLSSQLPGDSDTVGFEDLVQRPVRRQRGEGFELHAGDLLWLSAQSAPDAVGGVRPVTALRVVATPLG
jgi:hypothetical protein